MVQAAQTVAQLDVQKLENDARVERTEVQPDGEDTAVLAHPTDDIARKSLKQELEATGYDGYVCTIVVK